jgi:hypothetical protein
VLLLLPLLHRCGSMRSSGSRLWHGSRAVLLLLLLLHRCGCTCCLGRGMGLWWRRRLKRGIRFWGQHLCEHRYNNVSTFECVCVCVCVCA